ncbi:9258_t:CDS:2, partial [Racocetra fulgida]
MCNHENLNKIRSSHIEFKENEVESNEKNNKAESNNEDKSKSNKENEIEICETEIIKVINGYNYPIAKDARVFHKHRKLTQDATCMAVQMLKAGAKPNIIYEALRDENKEPIVTRRDISNLDQDNSNYIKNDLSLTNSDNGLLKSRLYEIETQYINFPDEQQKSTLLKQLDDILAVPEAKLKQKMKTNNAKKKQIKNVNSPQNSLMFHVEDQMPKILLNSRIPINDVDQVYNPKSNGNCGFRALAVAIRGNEENWNLVKLVMNSQLNKHIEVYRNWSGYNIELLKQILEFWKSPCSPSFWFLSPDCTQLAADTFSVPIAIFDTDNE